MVPASGQVNKKQRARPSKAEDVAIAQREPGHFRGRGSLVRGR